MKKIFKPGDRVQLRSGSPVMIVQRYAKDYNLWVGWHESNVIVECTWLDSQGHHKENFHQNNLIKVSAQNHYQIETKNKVQHFYSKNSKT